MRTNFILYVQDQELSTKFYREVLGMEPILDVPGMTEFQLSKDSVLGLMPEKGIKKLLGETIRDPEESNGIARCELYFSVDDAQTYLDRALEAGAKLLSPLAPRDWGDHAGYIGDRDGHVVAFAQKR